MGATQTTSRAGGYDFDKIGTLDLLSKTSVSLKSLLPNSGATLPNGVNILTKSNIHFVT